jgi:hypothetical protein
VQVDGISRERWCEFFECMRNRPFLWQAWEQVVRKMEEAPALRVEDILAREKLGTAPPDWRNQLKSIIAAAALDAYDSDPGRLERFAFGRCMRLLRGKVPAADVASALGGELQSRKSHGSR